MHLATHPPGCTAAAYVALLSGAKALTSPNKEQKTPLPNIPTVRKILKSVLSPKCPAKNIPTAYAAKNERST
jgi:hypothetical protein